MSAQQDERREGWIRLLTENGVPRSVAEEATEGPIDPKWNVRLGLLMVVLMVVLMAVFVTAIVLVAGLPCAGDFAINSGVAMLVGIFSSIFIAGTIMGYAQVAAPLSIRKSVFVGSFTNPNSVHFAKIAAQHATRHFGSAARFDDFDAHFNRSWLPWMFWPAVILFLCAILSLILLPSTCI